MTNKRQRQSSNTQNKGRIYNLALQKPKVVKSPGVAAPPVPPTPTPDVQIPSIARDVDSQLGVSGIGESNTQELGVSGVQESSLDSNVGVGKTAFQTISQTHPLFMRKFEPARRVLANPSWNMPVLYTWNGKLYNTLTTYAEWYACFAAVAIDDDYVPLFGLIVREALPSIWPNGPAQAIAEAKQAGIHVSGTELSSPLNPGKDFFDWMFIKKINPFVRDYLTKNYCIQY